MCENFNKFEKILGGVVVKTHNDENKNDFSKNFKLFRALENFDFFVLGS